MPIPSPSSNVKLFRRYNINIVPSIGFMPPSSDFISPKICFLVTMAVDRGGSVCNPQLVLGAIRDHNSSVVPSPTPPPRPRLLSLDFIAVRFGAPTRRRLIIGLRMLALSCFGAFRRSTVPPPLPFVHVNFQTYPRSTYKGTRIVS